jgi:hypothetical protein
MPISLAAGRHRIRIRGNLDAEIEFAVGVDPPTFAWQSIGQINLWVFDVVFVVVVVVYFFLLAVLFTFGRLIELVKLVHKWIRWSEADSHWLVVVFTSPLVIGRGMRKLPLWTKMTFVDAFAWGTAVPTGFFHIEGKVESCYGDEGMNQSEGASLGSVREQYWSLSDNNTPHVITSVMNNLIFHFCISRHARMVRVMSQSAVIVRSSARVF